MLKGLSKKLAAILVACLLVISLDSTAQTGLLRVTAVPSGRGYLLMFEGLSFDPLAGEPAVHQSLDRGPQSRGSGLYVVQWNGPIYEEQKKRIRSLGGVIGDYIPDSAFIVRMNADTAERVRDLGFVRFLGAYKPAYKVERSFLDHDGSVIKDYAGLERVSVSVTGFGGSQNLASELAAVGARILGRGGRTIVAEIPLKDLGRLAALDEVVSVGTIKPFVAFNDKASGVMKVSGIWQSGLYGEGQVVGVADTGLDTGKNNSSMHQDFQGRIKAIYSWGRPNDASDTHGHGTHVAGSILGDGARSGGQNKGMAPKSKLVFQSVADAQGQLSGIPNDLTQLFSQAYQAGARIHSDSWGAESRGGYDSTSADVDRFVWQNPEMTILIAAGNYGYNSGTKTTVYNTVGTPGTAKNAITVGASENNRPDKGAYGDDVNSMAVFSSRGYTADGRVKPDITAPGTWILSTRSSQAPNSNFWAPFNQYYAFMGGTSMATPLTAGTVALLREFYQTRLNVTPLASLLKATLINGSDDLGMGFPSRDQGWGRVNLQNSIQPADGRQFKFENEPVALSTGQTKEYQVSVKPGKPLRASLVWTDYPSTPSAGKTLVNDLDLQIVAPSGQILNGNDFISPFNDTADRINNVEIVRVAAPENGTYTIRVKAQNVPQGPQRFALVYSGDLGTGDGPNPPPQPPADEQPPVVELTSPRNGALVSGTVELSANASDDYGLARVEFLVDGTVVASDNEGPFSAAWNSTKASNGAHRISARAVDRAGNIAASGVTSVTVNNQGADPTPVPDPGGRVTQAFSGYAGYYVSNRYIYLDATRAGLLSLRLTWLGTADLDLYLYDPAGRLVGRSNTGANPEEINLQIGTPGRYLARVHAYRGSANFSFKASYPVDWTRTVVEDRTGSIAVGMRNEFEFTAGGPGSINATLDWYGTANLNLYLLDSGGRIILGSNGALRPEGISVGINSPGKYRILITSASGRASYRLRIIHGAG